MALVQSHTTATSVGEVSLRCHQSMGGLGESLVMMPLWKLLLLTMPWHNHNLLRASLCNSNTMYPPHLQTSLGEKSNDSIVYLMSVIIHIYSSSNFALVDEVHCVWWRQGDMRWCVVCVCVAQRILSLKSVSVRRKRSRVVWRTGRREERREQWVKEAKEKQWETNRKGKYMETLSWLWKFLGGSGIVHWLRKKWLFNKL